MSKRIKCVFVIRSLTGGGAERVVSVLANKMVMLGIETYIITYAKTNEDYILDCNVKVITMPHRKDSIYTKIKRIPDMRNIMKNINPDIVIPFVGTVLYVTWFATLGLKCKFILTVRSNPWMAPNTKIQRLFRDFIAKKSDAIMLQNEEQEEYFSKLLYKNIIVVNNPLSENFIKNEKKIYANRVQTIVAVGRLEPVKNHELLIRAFAKAFKMQNEISLYIYGSGKQKQVLENIIEELSLQNRVFLVNRVNNVDDILKRADLFVMTSKYEGMPNALMEAMMVGVPCISSDCKTGPKSLIKDFETGIFYSSEDEEDLIKKLRWAVSNPLYLSKIGKEARRFMLENYTEEKIIESMRKITDIVK